MYCSEIQNPTHTVIVPGLPLINVILLYNELLPHYVKSSYCSYNMHGKSLFPYNVYSVNLLVDVIGLTARIDSNVFSFKLANQQSPLQLAKLFYVT